MTNNNKKPTIMILVVQSYIRFQEKLHQFLYTPNG